MSGRRGRSGDRRVTAGALLLGAAALLVAAARQGQAPPPGPRSASPASPASPALPASPASMPPHVYVSYTIPPASPGSGVARGPAPPPYPDAASAGVDPDALTHLMLRAKLFHSDAVV
ncbi:MAG TPA: hypothetical protein VHB47_11655, partial [Thermoanaerobaculia bacterium]|nr:hypothetical protein [Thermoanaerobaculia bacterium]